LLIIVVYSCVKTYLWVLNDEDEYARALKYGASGIMTDFPSRLSQYLNHHHNHNERRTMLWCRLRCLYLCVIYGVVLLGNFVLLDVVVCWLLQLLFVMHCVLWQILQLSSIPALLRVCTHARNVCAHTHIEPFLQVNQKVRRQCR